MTVVRAYVAAIGGNAISGLRMQQHSMPDVEGAYLAVTVTGDAVHATYGTL